MLNFFIFIHCLYTLMFVYFTITNYVYIHTYIFDIPMSNNIPPKCNDAHLSSR